MLLDAGHLVAVVVTVVPCLGAAAQALLGDVPFVVVAIRPGAVACQAVVAPRRVAAHGPVAFLIIRVGLVVGAGGVGQLAVVVVAVGDAAVGAGITRQLIGVVIAIGQDH